MFMGSVSLRSEDQLTEEAVSRGNVSLGVVGRGVRAGRSYALHLH